MARLQWAPNFDHIFAMGTTSLQWAHNCDHMFAMGTTSLLQWAPNGDHMFAMAPLACNGHHIFAMGTTHRLAMLERDGVQKVGWHNAAE